MTILFHMRALIRKAPALRWCVYLVRCRDGTLYCGATNNLLARIAVHNTGKGARYTRPRRPVVLAWMKPCRSRSAALKLEWAIKSLPRRAKDELVTKYAMPRPRRRGAANSGRARALP